MAMLKHVKLANAIKAGAREENFLTNANFELHFTDEILAITCKRSGQKACTSIYNMIYWLGEDEASTVASPVKKIHRNVP